MELGKIMLGDITDADGVQAKHKYVINISVGTGLKIRKGSAVIYIASISRIFLFKSKIEATENCAWQ